jgi:hypothetical protein
MRRWLGVFVLGAGLWWTIGCRDGEPLPIGPRYAVSATRVTGAVRIVNLTGETFAYAVWNPNFLGLFAPCVDTTPSCPRLGPAETADVPDAEVVGYAPGMREAIVRWWRVLPDGAGGSRAGDVFEVVVALD